MGVSDESSASASKPNELRLNHDTDDRYHLSIADLLSLHGGFLASRIADAHILAGKQSAAVAEPLEDFEPVTIMVDQKGSKLELALNGNPLTGFADLNEKLAILAAASREMPIQLDVKPTVDLQNLISVYDAAHKHQLRKIVLLTNDN